MLCLVVAACSLAGGGAPSAVAARTREMRSAIARDTWRATALSEPEEREGVRWDLRERTRLFDAVPDAREKLEEFLGLAGTYYLNGLSSCRIGERLVHPFEAHGYVKALTFHGDGTATYRARVVQTPCAALERQSGTVLFRGVMSYAVRPGTPGPLGALAPLLNALSPQERNTANLCTRLWPPTQHAGPSAVEPVLIAGGDNGVPFALDPETLETRGPLPSSNAAFRALAGKRLLAHTRYDASRGRVVFAASDIELGPGGARSRLEFWEVDAQGEVVSHAQHGTDFMVMHDFAITEHYYVVPKNPARLEWRGLGRFLLGLSRGVGVFDMAREQQTAVLLIPRGHAREERRVVEAPAGGFFTSFHFGPCYERDGGAAASGASAGAGEGEGARAGAGAGARAGAGQLVVHANVFDQYRFGGEMGFVAEADDFDPIGWSASEDAPPPRLDRIVIDLESAAVVSRERLGATCARLHSAPPPPDEPEAFDVPVDMPTLHPLRDGQPARYCYCTGGARLEGWFPWNSVVKLDLGEGVPDGRRAAAWAAAETSVVSEPMFLPRADGGLVWRGAEHEDDGWLVSVVHDTVGGTCELVVFDAALFEQGPFAAVQLGELYPWDVHGQWVPHPRAAGAEAAAASHGPGQPGVGA